MMSLNPVMQYLYLYKNYTTTFHPLWKYCNDKTLWHVVSNDMTVTYAFVFCSKFEMTIKSYPMTIFLFLLYRKRKSLWWKSFAGDSYRKRICIYFSFNHFPQVWILFEYSQSRCMTESFFSVFIYFLILHNIFLNFHTIRMITMKTNELFLISIFSLFLIKRFTIIWKA